MTHDIIVKHHGGSIDIETEPGVFSEFISTMPLEAGAEELHRPAPSEPSRADALVDSQQRALANL